MANFLTNVSTNMDTVSLYNIGSGFYSGSFSKGANQTYNNINYSDVLNIVWSNSGTYYNSYFGGTGIKISTSNGSITAGTATGYLEYTYGSITPNWGIEGVKISAKSLYASALTSSSSDEIALFTTALAGNDTFTGSNFADTLYGFAGNDVMNGNSGNDSLYGGVGADTINGGAGQDLIYGGAGNDILTGGSNADSFVFDAALTNNKDTITDFSHAEGDMIYLRSNIFTQLAAGTLSSDAYYAGTAAHDATDRIIYNSLTGALSYDMDGTGSKKAVIFATLGTGLSISNTDFQVY